MVYVSDMIEENLCYILTDIVHKIEESFDITTSTTSLSRFLKSVKIATKNTLPIPEDWSTAAVIEKRADFIKKLGLMSLECTQFGWM